MSDDTKPEPIPGAADRIAFLNYCKRRGHDPKRVDLWEAFQEGIALGRRLRQIKEANDAQASLSRE
jgi:hypothetical protein